jgi:hypothetical protein
MFVAVVYDTALRTGYTEAAIATGTFVITDKLKIKANSKIFNKLFVVCDLYINNPLYSMFMLQSQI